MQEYIKIETSIPNYELQMFYLYHKESNTPINSNESLSDLFQDFVTNYSNHLTSPLRIELRKDS